ncbi:MarR family winged helix-turn-helix transcriptional regulator [Kitasatospora sp. NPDC101176]|uniref:MarR family winged helix-turn-helix transcriptional regulator n=1 Tax=Kitasatospora sp. NPDC101176 TaxID=3364099 RepID=UPI0038027B2F
MGIRDDAAEVRARGWRTLAALHGLIETALEKALQSEHRLSVVEYTVLDALSRQDGWHMRMQQLARAAALSSSATTRLVTRLEDRGLLARYLCADDRRGIYTELTPEGRTLLEAARPVHDAALEATLAQAAELPELAPLVRGLAELDDEATAEAGPGLTAARA